MQNRIITIIGLGHIGGSFAAAIREKGLFGEVWGLDKDHASVQTALRRGLIDGAPDWQQAIQQSDLILLATPVHVIPVQLLKILDEAPDHLVITDVGSTKGQIEQQVKDHPRRGQYVAAHPMAGTEHRGIEAAMADLFQGKFVVLCEKERSSPIAVQRVEELFLGLGMHLTSLSAAAHDLHVAYVSHLSHLSSFGLALTVLEKEQDEARIFELAASGFDSTVRLAKSNVDMWIPIFSQNREHLQTVLQEHLKTLGQFHDCLVKEDYGTLRQLLVRANDIRRILERKPETTLNA
jgi:prephenate dehydrogenase